MCLSIRGSCLNAACISNVRTPHCGAPPLKKINNNQQRSEIEAVGAVRLQQGGFGCCSGGEFFGGSVRVDSRTDSGDVSITLNAVGFLFE